MKLAFSSNAYLKFSFAEAARRISEAGFAGIEIMADVPHAWPAYLLPEQIHGIRAALDRHELTISNINAFMMHAIDDPRQKYWHPSWIEPDVHYRRIRIEHTRKALTLAKELGAPCITTEPGGPIGPNQTRQMALQTFVETIKPVADHAAQVGVMLLVEPEPGLLIETADQYEEFSDKLNHPAVGLNFDVGHFYCVANDPPSTVLRLQKHIRHVHLEDIAADRVHAHLIPGDGAIDIPATLRALHQIAYNGWITVELYPYIEDPDWAARQSFDYVRAAWKQLGV